VFSSSYAEASVELVSGSIDLPLIPPGNVFETDLWEGQLIT